MPRKDNRMKYSVDVGRMHEMLSRRVVGQCAAVEAVIDAYQIFRSGLANPDRPLGSFLFLGPTGTGKTNLVEAFADVCFCNRHAMLKVDCAEFSHSHEISKLIGSPPGYLGHSETTPYFSATNITRYHTLSSPFTLVLFDEIEKAHDTLWHLLLGILDTARLTLGNNSEVNFSNCFIFMTSNVGARAVAGALGEHIGFQGNAPDSPDELQTRVERIVHNAARKTFSPEFLNRIDRQVVFHRLEQAHLEQILALELAKVKERICRKIPGFVLEVNDEARAWFVENGTDYALGARPLKRLLEQTLVMPIARMISEGEIQQSSKAYVGIEWDRIDVRSGVATPKKAKAASAAF